MIFLLWQVLLAAAVLEIGGDAVVRKGLRRSNVAVVLAGCTALGCYGVVVNTVKWDFSKLLGVYVAVLAPVSVLFGRFVLKEHVPCSTWIGLAVIVLGAMIIQFGSN